MPRRAKIDPLALAVGQRIAQLRAEKGLTLEGLAFACEVSKGHLSSIERGRVRPTIQTLQSLAGGLGVLMLDLVTFPSEGDRERLVDATRRIGRGTLRRLLKDLRS